MRDRAILPFLFLIDMWSCYTCIDLVMILQYIYYKDRKCI